MASRDFNSFMDSYISDIRSNKPKQSVHKRVEEEHEKVPEGVSTSSVYVIKRPKTFWEKIVEVFTGTEEEDFEQRRTKSASKNEDEFDQEYEQLEKEDTRKGIWHRLTQLFATNVNDTYQEIDDAEREEHRISSSRERPQKKSVHVQSRANNNIYAREEGTSIWQNFLRFFGMDIQEEENDEEEVVPAEKDEDMEKLVDMKEDLKQVAIIATAAFKKLPKEQFELFKNSSDFAQFKKILGKHNIIKQKENP